MSKLIIITGEEEFLKEQKAKVEAYAVLSSIVMSYDLEEDLNTYIEEASMIPMFGETRVFILNNVTEIPYLPDTDDVIICIAPSKKKLKDSRASNTYNFPTLKTYSNNNEVIKWIISEGERLNIDLTKVASALFISSGKSLRKVASEIQKLLMITPPGGSVSPTDAKQVLCFSSDLNPSSVIDSMCEGNPAKALAFHDKLQERAEETGWIIAYLQRHVMRFLQIEMLVSEGKDSSYISSLLEIHPYVYQKTIDPKLGLWSIPSLVQSVDTLGKLDLLHKSGKEVSKLNLEMEIIRLSEEASQNVEHRSRIRN